MARRRRNRRFSRSWLLLIAGLPLAEAEASQDLFEELLELDALPHRSGPHLFRARFEFRISAPLSPAFLAGHFDLFPKPIGKLLNGHQALEAFEATLSRGRWRQEEWGPPPRDFRPPGAVLVGSFSRNSSRTDSGDRGRESLEAWQFLVSALSGTLCASLGSMDPDFKGAGATSSPGPLQLPPAWSERGQDLRFATLPYEPVCTENLTPWLKLLPCNRHRGLAALLMPLALANAPLLSLSLTGLVERSQPAAKASLRATLDVIQQLPEWADGPPDGSEGLQAWFGDSAEFQHCPAASSSSVVRWPRRQGQQQLLQGLRQPTEEFSAPSSEAAEGTVVNFGILGEGLSVMRDILTQEGRSERTHGRYLLRFTNPAKARLVRFMDQVPFFIRPLWHTLKVLVSDSSGRVVEEHDGSGAIQRLQLRFVASNGHSTPTEVFIATDVPEGFTVSVFLNVLKNFIGTREFSFACEKGFDVGSAVWAEAELSTESLGPVTTGDLTKSWVSDLSGSAAIPTWRIRFTEGLLVLVPMPDFSMPFNVIALSSTAVTFFFGSVFRLTAGGREPHWASLPSPEEAAVLAALAAKARRKRNLLLFGLLTAVIALGAGCIHSSEASDLLALLELLKTELRLPEGVVGQLRTGVLKAKVSLTEVLGQ